MTPVDQLLALTKEMRTFLEAQLPAAKRESSAEAAPTPPKPVKATPQPKPTPVAAPKPQKVQPKKQEPITANMPRFALHPLEPASGVELAPMHQMVRRLNPNFQAASFLPPILICVYHESERLFLEKVASALTQHVALATTYYVGGFDQKQWDKLLASPSIQLIISVSTKRLPSTKQKSFHQPFAINDSTHLFLLHPIESYANDKPLKLALWKSLKSTALPQSL